MNIGDEVKVTGDYFYNNTGFITEIVECSQLPYTVVFDGEDEFNYFAEHELELLS